MHGGQREVTHGRERRVVVAHERDVLGHAQAALLDRVQRSDGGEVVRGEDRGGPRPSLQQFAGALIAAGLGIGPPPDRDFGGELQLAHGLLVAPAPLQSTSTFAAVYVGDASMAQGHAVLHHREGARGIVVGHAVDRRRASRTADHHHRHFPARPHDLGALHHGRPEDEAVDPELHEGLDGLVLVLLDPVAGVHQHAVAQGPGPRLNPRDDVREERIVEVGDEHAHDARALLNEALGHGVRAVPEFGHRAQRRGAALGAHVTVAADHQGHQRLRHACVPRHIVDRRASSRLHA